MPKRSPRDRLMEKILACVDMLQGSIVKINARCGKKGCKCERGQYHGISYYLSYKEGGRTQMVYIPRHLITEVKRKVEDFKKYRQLGVELAQINLKELRGKEKRRQ